MKKINFSKQNYGNGNFLKTKYMKLLFFPSKSKTKYEGEHNNETLVNLPSQIVILSCCNPLTHWDLFSFQAKSVLNGQFG